MTRQPTLDARTSLAMDLSGMRLIEASAGTGKTYTIANLYLRQVLAGRAPSEILVVSFTNAATDELQQRIHARLYQAQRAFAGGQRLDDEFLELLSQAHDGADAEERLRQTGCLQRALRSMDEAMISTIHGFCHAALQDHALLSNRQFESELTGDDDEYWNQALKDWWRETTYPLGEPEWALFSQAVPKLSTLIKWQTRLRQHPHDRVIPAIDEPLARLLQENRLAEPGAENFDYLLNGLRARALGEAHDYSRKRVEAAKYRRAELSYQDQLELLLSALRQPGGARLAKRLRERFPVAMIDEFQDTDSLQLEIFQVLYRGQAETSLTLIGDPKQAIYGFRGGDIFSYIEARDEPGLEIYALQENWRSTPEVVDAINFLFSRRPAPFIYDRAISFLPAKAAPAGKATPLTIDAEPAAALTVWQLPLRENGKTMGVGEITAMINRAVVGEIARLLDARNAVRVDDRPLHSGDIAVLVRTNDEGEAIRACLADAGIDSVSIGRDSVFASDEANGLFDLLDAVAQPGDEIRLRRARACKLFNLDYRELEAAIGDDSRWQAWIDDIRALHDAWVNFGFISMFQQLLVTLDPGNRLARREDAERRLTNLSQLAELLQRQSRTTPGIGSLMGWMRQRMEGDSDEETELRLESDAELVKIVTIHKSKGLEYPVVFLPFMWRCRPVSLKDLPLRFHDHDNRAHLDLGSGDIDAHLPIADKERLAEDLRLLYVALTRSKSSLYLAWGDVGDGRSPGRPMRSALGYLLHPRQTAADLDSALPDAFDDPAAMLDQLRQLADACPQIELRDLPDGGRAVTAPEERAADSALAARDFGRRLGLSFRINSFSGLTRDVHQAPLAGERVSRGDPILDFPAGSHVGLLLHELLEELDFTGDIDGQSQALIARKAPVYGLDGESQRQILAQWLESILATDLGTPGLRLGRLANERRLNELKFDFALDRCDIGALNRLLQQSSSMPLQPIDAVEFRGLLTGIIDLVFEYRGKYYLADYKSNFLGASLGDYRPEALSRAMLDRRYDLQALLYSLALHRYLRQRLPDYDYEQHFGGNYYLFLRAMRPQHGPAYGVHFDCPPVSTIDALDKLFAFTPVEEFVS
ncbi:MAG: UvrD-helicase domain-containing protein [Gammaproteobacteria bacterium]|jgi:exodeoxyribonuclease V beta subunit